MLTKARLKTKAEKETKLWQAVIFQAAEDAIMTSAKKTKQKIKFEAINWLKFSETEVKQICEHADIRFSKIKNLTDKFLN